MAKSIMWYLWSADAVVIRDGIDDPQFFEVNNIVTVTFGDADVFNDQEMQDSSREWLAAHLDVDPDSITFLNYAWSDLDPVPTDSASAAL